MRLRVEISGPIVFALLAFSGCSYVHFGRLPVSPAPVMGDEKLTKENGELRIEKKLLQQELALTRSQGDALRTVIENRTADGDTAKRLTEKLNETTRELATLRASYAKLQVESAQAPANAAAIATLQSKLGASEEKLADSLHNYTQLQEDIGHLRTQVDQTRTENLALTEKVKVVTAQNEQAQAALAQLNTDLLAQKEQRTRVEQDAATLRTQLESANTRISTLAQQRSASAAEARSLTTTDADPSNLRTQLDELRKKVWSLESERAALQQQLAASEAAAKNPSLADTKARAETEAKLAAALDSAKMLRDENSQLKASAAPLTAQALSLRDQLRQTEARVSALSDENSMLKARLSVVGTTSTPAAVTSTIPVPSSGVTATFVTNTPGQNNLDITRRSGAALRFHTVAAGDTLSKISNTYYGTPSRWSDILVANRDILGESNNLVIGRTLRIP